MCTASPAPYLLCFQLELSRKWEGFCEHGDGGLPLGVDEEKRKFIEDLLLLSQASRQEPPERSSLRGM
jgi:hypothetical protein